MLSGISAALRRLASLFQEEQGQDLAEYSLILAFVAVGCVVVLGALMVFISGLLGSFTATFP